ncbi:MAG: hypothetical protein SGILL_006715 [Bacillariaceae sp.]
MAKKSTDNNNKKIPAVARFWVALHDALPTITVPFTKNLDITLTLASALFLTSVRLTAEYVLVNYFGWPEGDTLTKEASSSCGSITHSMTLCTGLIVAFATQKCQPAARMDESPLWWQKFADSLLQFCTGYMVYDAIINILYLRYDSTLQTIVLGDDDKLFLIHHIMTTTYMTSARILRAGHMSAMTCMLMGELTNPLHNMYMMGDVAMKLECCNGPGAQKFHAVISVAFAAMYNLFRAVLAPPVFAWVSYCLIITKRGRTNIPLPLNLLWNLMIWGVVFGSSSWIVKCHGILMDFVEGLSSDNGTTSEL